MTKYKRLTIEERERIHALVNQGKTHREISSDLRSFRDKIEFQNFLISRPIIITKASANSYWSKA